MKNTFSYQAYQSSPYRSIKHSTYFDSYDDLFARYRGKNMTFVEIGVLGGGSLFMWRKFFGDNARIIGVDLNPQARKWESSGFEIFIGSQSDEAFWQSFVAEVGPIDVVLDDGGHTYEQQITTAECLLPHINDGGMLVVEDTHTSYLNGYGPRHYSFINYVKRCIDKINHRFRRLRKRGFDDRVWSVQIYESIVAFHVNRRASNLRSEPTDNDGQVDSTADYRHAENKAFQRFQSIPSALPFIRRLPGFKVIERQFLKLSVNWQNRSKIAKFFE